MPNILYFKDSKHYHLTPRNMQGFDVPDDLWQRYLQSRADWVWNPGEYFRDRSEILMLEREWLRLTKPTKRAIK